MEHSAYHLLKQRKFLPLFLTQFLGAFNDNAFKNALVILITYTLSVQTLNPEAMVVLAGAIFIATIAGVCQTAGC